MTIFKYKPHWVCSRQMNIELDGDIIKHVEIVGGCSGNTAGVCALAEGQHASDVIKRLEGIKCGPRRKSCPDQLAKALREALAL